jgi:hypothetical protein
MISVFRLDITGLAAALAFNNRIWTTAKAGWNAVNRRLKQGFPSSAKKIISAGSPVYSRSGISFCSAILKQDVGKIVLLSGIPYIFAFKSMIVFLSMVRINWLLHGNG